MLVWGRGGSMPIHYTSGGGRGINIYTSLQRNHNLSILCPRGIWEVLSFSGVFFFYRNSLIRGPAHTALALLELARTHSMQRASYHMSTRTIPKLLRL